MARPVNSRASLSPLDTLEFEIISELMADAAGLSIDKPGILNFAGTVTFEGTRYVRKIISHSGDVTP